MINSAGVQGSKSRPVVATIAGSDSAGMAGIQMDVRSQTAMSVHSATAITAVTAQHNQQLLSVNPVPAAVLEEQLQMIGEMPVASVKIGLIASTEQLTVMTDFMGQTGQSVVYDPVFASTSGSDFATPGFIAAVKERFLQQCTLVTPNLSEAEQMTGLSINNCEDMENAAKAILAMGAQAVLIKGGHADGGQWHDSLVQDYFYSRHQSYWLSSSRQLTDNRRGTGCALASAIAAVLAHGFSLTDAVVIGKMAINQGLRQSYVIGTGDDIEQGGVAISHFPNQQCDLPLLTSSPEVDVSPSTFPGCGETPLGLYPVVDRASWLERLLPLGVKTIQLRVKDLYGDALRGEIAESIRLAEQHQCRLFINDYWQLAIELGAYGVHLGQEDLETADINAIRQAGLRLGISSHCHYEVARAHSLSPSYIACGPVYHTNTKDMPWVPQGVDGLSYWLKTLDYPMVAIGGIGREQMVDVAATGVSGVAMITAITEADAPEQTATEFQRMITAARAHHHG